MIWVCKCFFDYSNIVMEYLITVVNYTLIDLKYIFYLHNKYIY